MKNAEKRPENHLDLGQIMDSSTLVLPQPCIYYLIDARNEVVYIGQTTNLQARLREHKVTGLDFVRFRFFQCDECDLDRLQQGAIARLNPPLNKPQKTKSTLGSLSKQLICLKYNITPIAFERLRESFGLKATSSFGNVKYYRPEDVDAWVRRFNRLVLSGRHVLQAKPTYLAVGISTRTKQIQLYTKQ
ncbi:GIY-YIG nuclease family protein [Spirosoma radiotolerans]|nr:GIY-YIG nuclease family protein [Spirosoma radiotolerans]